VKLLPIPDDREAWHALRGVHVGASEVAALFGVQPDYAPGLLALWLDRAGKVPLPRVENPRVEWGLRLEEAIAAGAAEREGWDVLPGLYASRDGLGATLDRRIAAPCAGDEGCEGPGVLELKNADWLAHRRAWGDEPPTHILLQLQAQLAATGYSWGAIAVLVGGNDLRIYRYRARPALQAEILRRVVAFWASVRAGKAPAADGSDATFRALAALAPDVEEEPAAWDAEAEAEVAVLAASYAQAQAAEKEAAKAKDEARNRLMQRLGEARWGLAPGWRVSQAITPAKPDRAAEPGEIIKGRAESRRLIVSTR
jgi:predicted phage-related endonuclease